MRNKKLLNLFKSKFDHTKTEQNLSSTPVKNMILSKEKAKTRSALDKYKNVFPITPRQILPDFEFKNSLSPKEAPNKMCNPSVPAFENMRIKSEKVQISTIVQNLMKVLNTQPKDIGS